MDDQFALHVLQQIYEFLLEREGFKGTSSHSKTVSFFEELHLGIRDKFYYDQSGKVVGSFGRFSSINLKNAPDFSKKNQFIEWAYSSLN